MDVIFVDFKENPSANPPIDSNVVLGRNDLSRVITSFYG